MERSKGLSKQALSEFREVIRIRREEGPKQKTYDWGWYGNKYHGASDYSGTFRQILEVSVNDGNLPPHDLRELIKRKRQQLGVPMVLDVMGYGAVLASLNVDGCAIALTDQRTRKMIRLDEALDRGFVAGDVRESDTWRRAQRWQEARGRKFDVILCRPLDGLSQVNKNETFYGYFFNRLYSMLSYENGLLFIQYHWEMRNFVSRMAQKLNDVPGLFANASSRCFMLEKHHPAPERLTDLSTYR